ncbi:organic cation transporter protein-like isoform X2 [Panulirus ornatus]|uniref:organic cation transporter protein-like isoform X2 n=1 Tax=Panulirus ornatus TaxID=150431 RepID=UPI003A894D63
MVFHDFESILTHIGAFGRYQWVLLLANCLMSVYLATVVYGQFFMTLTPPHWCSAPPDLLALNLTPHQLKVLTVPRLKGGSDDFHSCARYDVNRTQVMLNANHQPDPTWPVTTCTHGWTYNYSLYYPTITSQLDWVCDEDWKPPLAQTLFYLGSMIGSSLLGWAADRWGRLPLVVFCNLLGAVAGVVSAFSTSFVMFCVLRFVVGHTYEQLYGIGLILLLEYVGTAYRTVMTNVPMMLFLSLACCLMPWLAYGLADWTNFAIVIHSIQFLSIFFIWLLPESARWLLSKGRVQETLAIIKKVAKVNQKSLSPDVIKEVHEYVEKKALEEASTASVLDLFKTPVLRRRFLGLCGMWMSLAITFDFHMRYTKNLGFDVFVSFTLASFTEMPADLLTMVTTERLGRRHTAVWSFFITFLIDFFQVFINGDSKMTSLGMCVAGRFFITMTMNVMHQYTVEVVPTVARSQAVGLLLSLAALSASLSSYVVYLSKYGHYLPYLIISLVALSGMVSSLLLPETLRQDLPDSLHDGETFFTNQSCCYNPCTRRKEARPDDQTVRGATGHDNPAFEVTHM